MNTDKTEMEEIEVVFEDVEEGGKEAKDDTPSGKKALIKEAKPKAAKSKEPKPKEVKQKDVKVGDVLLTRHSCVIRNFEDMQQAKRVLSSLSKTFPQFSLPFMYDDELPTWPVRVDHRCWRCEGPKAREWTFMYSDERVEQLYICEGCETLSPCMTIWYADGKLTFTSISGEEHWDAIAEFKNDWKRILSRAKAEHSAFLRLLARTSYWGHRLISGATEEEKKRKEEKKREEALQKEERAKERQRQEALRKEEKEKERQKKEAERKEAQAKKAQAEKEKAEKEKAEKEKDKKAADKGDKSKEEKPTKAPAAADDSTEDITIDEDLSEVEPEKD